MHYLLLLNASSRHLPTQSVLALVFVNFICFSKRTGTLRSRGHSTRILLPHSLCLPPYLEGSLLADLAFEGNSRLHVPVISVYSVREYAPALSLCLVVRTAGYAAVCIDRNLMIHINASAGGAVASS